ncbi:sulfurtransferase [Magnetovirga frankeli]|uniref:rhodanese-like domain-containing protein n=1 Tax=Magnetovirga frankeli TaxID=947516 RepID=UPI001293637C|nr:sulfurtransferase [gamma proteobacterium SS-5]
MQIKEIDVDELQSRLAGGEDIRLLDIRSDAELNVGMLPQAEHLPMHLIPLKMQEFRQAPQRQVVLYCRSGARSAHACAYLMQQGIDNVINLRGGIIAWAQQGHEIRPRG